MSKLNFKGTIYCAGAVSKEDLRRAGYISAFGTQGNVYAVETQCRVDRLENGDADYRYVYDGEGETDGGGALWTVYRRERPSSSAPSMETYEKPRPENGPEEL